jgi:hypothetical protein
MPPTRHAAIALLSLAILCPPAKAWVLNVTSGPRTVYLAVGNATINGDNATINLISLNLPLTAVTSGVPQPMVTDSTQVISPYDNYTLCTPSAGQVYVGGFFRMPSTSAVTAVLQVSTPAALTNGTFSIPFSEISWTSTAIGNAAADIPAGNFVNGGTLLLRNFSANTYVENCHTFSYANTNVVASGTYNGRATYTLTAP